jgi:hypothetical protein
MNTKKDTEPLTGLDIIKAIRDRRRIASYLSFPIALILLLIAKSNVWTWQKRGEVPWDIAYWILASICFVVYMAYYDIKTKRLQRISKDLKMSARLRAKKKGQAFTG